MKVILLAPTPPPAGGIAGWTVRMMNATLKNGWGIEVVDEKIGKDRQLFGDTKRRNFFAEAKRCMKIWRDLSDKLKDPEVKVVHSCIPSATLSMLREYICALITKAKKRKFIIHFRCTVPNNIKSKTSEFVFKRICNKSDRIILLNNQSVEFTKKFTKTPIDLIPNFIDLDEIASAKEINAELKNVVYVGGVIQTKGCADVIEVAKAFPGITFNLVGSASTEISEMASGVSNVNLMGVKSKSEVKEILSESDVFIFLSYFSGEGFSNALAEAMAMGLPCLVTDWAANADMIEDKGGFAVPVKAPGEAIDALKKMSPQAVRKSQSEFNLKKSREVYSSQAVLPQYVDSYEITISED